MMLLTARPSSALTGGFSISEVSGAIEAIVAIANLALAIGFFCLGAPGLQNQRAETA